MHDHGDIPELPIPRPGAPAVQRLGAHARSLASDTTQAAATSVEPISGGASFTAVDPTDLPASYAHPSQPALGSPAHVPAPAAPAAPPEPPAAHRRDLRSEDRFEWELASNLTAGMLANPAKSACSVKDAMALFESVLQEVRTYRTLAIDDEERRGELERRRLEHGQWFHAADAATTAARELRQPRPFVTAPTRPPGHDASAVPQVAVPLAQPDLQPPTQQVAPPAPHHPPLLPPPVRATSEGGAYRPGSMAGQPPTVPDLDTDDDVTAAA